MTRQIKASRRDQPRPPPQRAQMNVNRPLLESAIVMPISLLEKADNARDWLITVACPLWFDKGIDWVHGGFFDALDPLSTENAVNRKRLRVAARHIYVFSQATRLGFSKGEAAVLHGLDFLFSRARHPEGAFVSSFDIASRQTSADRDTYDLAFVLFALAHAHRLLGDARSLIEAEQLARFIDVVLRHRCGGFLEGLPHHLPRRQNPHMHLLEACIAWLPFDRGGIFRRLADELVTLFETAFVDKESGAILEYFNESLEREKDCFGNVVEPGHLFEWFWLLSSYRRVTNRPVASLPKIYEFAHCYGKNAENGLLFGGLSHSGSLQDRSVRLWPHAEWVRAELINFETNPGGDSSRLELALSALWRFLAAPIPGLWFERFDHGVNAFRQEPAPASSFYHIVGAFSALINAHTSAMQNLKQSYGAETVNVAARLSYSPESDLY
jgi:mannose/cellobiose epimerase-like protein (N-acyl-D-glucosamine 2-epimerase family)